MFVCAGLLLVGGAMAAVLVRPAPSDEPAQPVEEPVRQFSCPVDGPAMQSCPRDGPLVSRLP